MDMPADLHDIVNFILDRWRQAGMVLSQTHMTQIHRCLTSHRALSEAVVSRINHYTTTCSPAETTPAWLRDIDTFFQQPADQELPVRANKSV
jgi:hypothetical protein